MKPEVAVIVAKQDFVNMTAVIPITPIFTPTVDGLYRISLYGETGDTNPIDYMRVSISWTDDYFNRAPEGTGGNLQGGLIVVLTYVVRAKAGAPITISTSIVSGAAPSPYSIYTAVEEL